MKTGVIVTGLPASGKTTIARIIANGISFDLLDKDDFLEGLYEDNNVVTWENRKTLSRQSDVLFQSAAEQSGSAVLVSHWRPVNERSESGTPTNWLHGTYLSLIEVCCLCSVDTAIQRFLTRQRHPGHLDQKRDPAELALRMRDLGNRYPLGIGPVLEVRTDTKVDRQAVVDKMRLLLAGDLCQPK